MEWQIEFGDGPFEVVVTTRGDASADGFIAFTHEYLSDPRWRPGLNLLLDHSRLASADLTTADLRRVADHARRRDAETGPGYMALVAGSAAAFGLARMFQTFRGDDSSRQVHVVSSVEEAYAWLASEQAQEST